MAALYKMFSCQVGLNWIYGECTLKNVLLSMWFDLVRHEYGTNPLCSSTNYSIFLSPLLELFFFDGSSNKQLLLQFSGRYLNWLFLSPVLCLMSTPNAGFAEKMKKMQESYKFGANLAKKGFFKFAPKRWLNVLFPV